jgi:predicted ATPase/DNA-binding CsgD family transcriptional regulator
VTVPPAGVPPTGPPPGGVPPAGGRRDNLPAEATRFIGRRRELPAIADAIAGHRLVTLRGTAGVGKTRLALRAAAMARDSFADGCWLAELSALRDPALLPRTVSAALGLPDEAAGDPLAVLIAHLAGQEVLLVLDTCEHIVGACADLAAALLAAAPGLRILATSREPLGIPAEHVLTIAPLELPGRPAAADAAPPGGYRAADYDAIALFVDRGQAAMPEFALTPQNAEVVAELCRRLDGIPLALELAAVRLRSMAPEEILGRLDSGFAILGTARTNVGRHRTLQAAVDWSYGLCTPDEQALWARLAVFPGSFDAAAAEHVCGPGTPEALARLAGKSIVQHDEAAGRYRMLDTMREFGAEQLADADGPRGRHLEFYAALVERAAAGTLSPAQVTWMSRLQQETDNLRAALDWSLSTPGRAATGLRMTVLLRTYWLMTGLFTEGRRWHKRAVAVAPGTADNAWAVYGTAILAVQQGDLAEGAPLLARAARLAAGLGDADLAAHVTDAEGIVAFYGGDLPTAAARHESALAWYEQAGFSDAFALSSYGRLASVCLLNMDIAGATRLCEEYLRRCDEVGEQWGRGTALWVRGGARWLSGDNEAAVTDALASLAIKADLGDLHTVTMAFDLLAVCAAAQAEYERAAVLYGAGDKFWKILNAPIQMGPGYAAIRRSAGDTAREQLGAERYTAAYEHGRALTLADAIAVARGEQPALPGGGQPARPLTRRERQIAGLVADGLGNRDIAERLYLSKRTVDSHLEHIFGKLGFTSRTQLTEWVREQPADS